MRYAIARFNNSATPWIWCAVVLATITFVSGCKPEGEAGASPSSKQGSTEADDHAHEAHEHDTADGDHEEHSPQTPQEALSSLEATFAEIKAAFEKETPEDAHHELHEVGHLLESFEQLVKENAQWTDEQRKPVNESLATLFENFGVLDDSLHGVEDADTKGALERLSDTIGKLKEQLQ